MSQLFLYVLRIVCGRQINVFTWQGIEPLQHYSIISLHTFGVITLVFQLSETILTTKSALTGDHMICWVLFKFQQFFIIRPHTIYNTTRCENTVLPGKPGSGFVRILSTD